MDARRLGQSLVIVTDATVAFRRYATRPERLRQELEAAAPHGSDLNRQVVIDEIQKVPALLDEVHWLIERRGMHFALCGSSARKVRHGAANLLGGRALRVVASGGGRGVQRVAHEFCAHVVGHRVTDETP